MVFGEPGSSATSTTWSNVPLCSVTAMPTFFASDAQSVSISPKYAGSLMYSTLNASLVPAGMPLPHSPAPVPGLAQVLTPPATTFQPCDFSRLPAVVILNGYGFVIALAGLYGDTGTAGTGPYASPPAPWKKAWT